MSLLFIKLEEDTPKHNNDVRRSLVKNLYLCRGKQNDVVLCLDVDPTRCFVGRDRHKSTMSNLVGFPGHVLYERNNEKSRLTVS